MLRIFFSTLAALLLAGSVYAADRVKVHVVQYTDDGRGERVLIATAEESSAWILEGDEVVEESFPRYIAEHSPLSDETIVTLKSPSRSALQRELRARGVQSPTDLESEAAADEVVTLVDNGPSENRIDVVFMGDGYTAAERETFFEDMQRMVGDMFRDVTFRSYLPLFNVHAVFRPSNESGIGRNDRPKDTAYGLYRAGNTLRAIYAAKPSAARASCAKAPGCDYPVIIGNDPHYGGLGGEFAISTNSMTSGTVVLRHELGHNFGRVGEEYDGGGYFGANHSSSLSSLKWRHWATSAAVRAEPAVSRFVSWPWHNLSGRPYRAQFRSDGTYDFVQIRFSASGMPNEGDLRVTLDGGPIAFTAPGNDDRNFYTIELPYGLSAGTHVMEFTEGVADGNNWISSVNIQEYKADYHFEDEHYGAYTVFDQSNRAAGYRATHEACLMRNMQSQVFCSVCQENNWLQFFDRVRIIDSLTSETKESGVTVRLKTQALGQLRADYQGKESDGELEIRWYKDGVEVPELSGLTSWSKPARDAQGRWEARVRFVTPEVRQDPRGLLTDRATLNL